MTVDVTIVTLLLYFIFDSFGDVKLKEYRGKITPPFLTFIYGKLRKNLHLHHPHKSRQYL